MGLISAVMALGVNIQWGYAGLFNVGVMGFVALGRPGHGADLAMPPVPEAWAAGGAPDDCCADPSAPPRLAPGSSACQEDRMPGKHAHAWRDRASWCLGLHPLQRSMFDPARDAIEAVNPALAPGYLGGRACRSCWPGPRAHCLPPAPPGSSARPRSGCARTISPSPLWALPRSSSPC